MTKSNRWSVFRGGIALKTLISAIMIVCMVCSVQAAVEADFEATPTSGTVPLIVAFTDNSTGKISNWLWDFGDGFASLLKNPLHMYLFAGKFNVSLTVTDDVESNTTSDNITVVYPQSELQYQTAPDQIPATLTVNKFYAETDPSTGTFEAEFQAFPKPIEEGCNYFCWNFSDGNTELTTVPSVTHFYEPGIYQPWVTVQCHSECPDGYENGFGQVTQNGGYTINLPTYLIVVSGDLSEIPDYLIIPVEV